MQVYREVLPNSYLVILVESAPAATDTGLLCNALRQASRSGKGQIWLDCSGLSVLSSDMLLVLTRYAARLRRRHTSLVVCHPPTMPAGTSLVQASEGNILVANTLLDAELVATQSVSE
ncbi:hypothetical protein MUN82_10830 [Hymenobacter aerilatus]|uniref:STAS domain-containing protein n=1 Tax=Hymenobacter aerilatus TaxID=2932251 RepID=A0A8T9T6X5_9BACT|nr:hypothetical protein [Hymenobacter aerilatus]UOR07569.1 hypothetical protein MUN82_10830 [Hymenobacter aerilatus]